MTLQWFTSKTVRHATAMRKHARRILAAQIDILSPQAIEAVNAALDELGKAIQSNLKKEDLLKEMEKLETVANKWLKPYPHAVWRENIEVLLVALAVAMGIRTFFLQPFKIPTGSMQPTLYGVNSTNLLNQPNVQIPKGLNRFMEWVHGNSYVHVVAEHDGALEAVEAPRKLLILNLWQRVKIGGHWQTIWLPPDYGDARAGLQNRAELVPGQTYKAGDDVIKLQVKAGDYLFVNRLTYNFRPPQRGEIIVFETRGIDADKRQPSSGRWEIPPDQFYIKRLVGLGGEHVSIVDNHLVIDGKRLDASTPSFENVYSGKNGYVGHLPQELFSSGNGWDVPKRRLMVMGDNTGSSLDSRYFGDFDANSVIGKSSFVYWPLTERFGFGYR